ncbi:hypothetical protein N018_14310 [Pseudomonas syringae CC1557]|uniref:Uncharacterized protein n=1 Tax=Pseudomonas syringae CC1557 TaxID=1357279 RepID=W0N2B9_PSESX|nr:hypothetical protein N018_14310 [Pseudomonas syringae CC1557]
MLYVNSDGTKATIHFIWGKKKNPVPRGLDVTVKLPGRRGRDVMIHCDHQAYRSLSQAKKRGIILVEGIVALLNELLSP